MVFLEPMAELVSWALLVVVVHLVLLVPEVPMEILVALESLASWDPEVFLVPPEVLAHLVKKVPWASLASTAGPDPSAQQGHEESLATLDSLDPRAPVVNLAKLAKRDTLVFPVLGVLQVLMETMVLRGLLDHKVSKVEKVIKAQLVLQASRDCLALQVQPVSLANQEKGVSLVNLVSLVLLAQEESAGLQVKVVLWAPPVLLETEVLLDPQGLRETRVSPVPSALRAPLVHLALVDSQERGALLACLGAKEKRVKLASEVKWGAQAETVLVVLLVLWVPPVLLEPLVTGERLVLLVLLVLPVLVVVLVNVEKLVPPVPMDLLVLLALLVNLVLKEREEPEDPRVKMVLSAPQAPLELLDHLVQMVPLVLLEVEVMVAPLA